MRKRDKDLMRKLRRKRAKPDTTSHDAPKPKDGTASKASRTIAGAPASPTSTR